MGITVSKQMLCFSETQWANEISSTESVGEMCLRKGIPAYIKVQRVSQLVYRYYYAWKEVCRNIIFGRIESFSLLGPNWKVNHLIFPMFQLEGLDNEMRYLRLDDLTLADLIISGSTSVSSFSHGGFSIPRPYDTKEHTGRGSPPREYKAIREATLENVEFTRAVLVDRATWELALSNAKEAIKGFRSFHTPIAKDYALSVDIVENDLYLMAGDIDVLKRESQQSRELVKYPFNGQEYMPGIYWIFQAAYALNHKLLIDEAEVLDWLRECGCAEEFAGKRGGCAAKLVPIKWDRSKGRKGGPRPFKIWDIENWADKPTQFDIDFVGDGLKVALAAAEWWIDILKDDPDTSRVVLAKQLYEQNFDQTESGYVVRLIAGAELSKEEKGLFAEWVVRKKAEEDQKLVKELS